MPTSLYRYALTYWIDIEDMCYAVISDAQKSELEENKELDFALEIPNIGRYKVIITIL